jgi:type IV secretory pathway protease TraF
MSDVSRTSFDGRYFGPISRAQIRTVIVPVFTW